MNLEADYFATKPQILLARIHSLLKRTYQQPQNSDMLTYKELTLKEPLQLLIIALS